MSRSLAACQRLRGQIGNLPHIVGRIANPSHTVAAIRRVADLGRRIAGKVRRTPRGCDGDSDPA